MTTLTKGRTVLLVTNDLKIDWWDHDAFGIPVAPNSDLREEMQRVTGQGFYATTFAEFRRLAPRALLPAEKTQLVAVASSGGGFRLVQPWHRTNAVPAWMLTAIARRPAPIGLMRVLQEDAASRTMRRLVSGMITPHVGLDAAARFDPLREAREAMGGVNRSRELLTAMGVPRSMFNPRAWEVARPLSGIAAIHAGVLARGPNYAVPDMTRYIDQIQSGMFLKPDISSRYASAAERMYFLSALHGGTAIDRAWVLPDTLRLAESARVFQQNEARMVRMALGEDAPLEGFSAILNPRINAYAEQHGLMERPVREIIARMRDERLRREAEAGADVQSADAEVVD